MNHQWFSYAMLLFLFCAKAQSKDCTAVFTEPPKNVPTYHMPDGPLLGNGDVGIVLAGPPEEQRFFIGKNDWWGYGDGSRAMPVGGLTLAIAELKGASYRQEQDMALAEVRGTFAKGEVAVQTRSFVDAGSNLLVTEVTCTGTKPVTAVFSQRNGLEEPWGTNHATLPAGILCYTRKSGDAPPEKRMDIAVASRIIGGAPVVDTAGTGTLKLTLQAGEAVTIVTCVLSKLDDPDFLEAAKQKVLSLEAKDIPAMTARHRDWWKGFWSKSFIEIPDKEIEKRWYAALYVMGSCSKPGKVAPGLWGCWVTIFAQWQGDYHLNYNFQAPYYIVYSSNHADLSAPFYQAIQESLPRAREMASKHGWKGVHFPVCIGPRGIFPEGEKDHGQRSNAAYVALNFIWQYQYTQDKEFLKTTAYPYLLEVADFWEDYLKLEKGRYVIHNDAIHEGSGENMNPLLSLGLVRTLFKNLIVMSQDLGVDKARRARWQDLQDRLSAFPLQERNGKTVFRLTEKGMDWATGNTLEIQHIFPAGTIGLDSDPKVLQICHNTLNEMNRWTDNNGFSSWYTTCARVGYDPQVILSKLREECDKHSFPNLLLFYGGGGVESCGGFLAVNEMLLQSHEGVLRFFPCWPKDQDARFGTLRAVGAFLVSAELQNGVVSGVKIVSEKGCPCTVQNPWPGKTVKVLRNGKAGKSAKGDRFTLKTAVNEVIELQPAGGTAGSGLVPAGEKTQVPVAGGGSQPVDIVYAKTMPGDASARQKGNAFILSNSALEMGWTLENGHLLLSRIKDKNKDRAYDQHGEIFSLQIDNGTRISSSACELVGAPALEVLKPVPASACAAQHLKGWQLSARFRHPATGLTVQWRAELRDGSHYVRQLLRVEGDKGKLTEVRCLEASVGRAWNEGTAMAGNPVVSDHLFMGQELPMSKNLAPGGGVPDKWTPADMLSKSINRKIKELKPGPLSVQFAYERGVFRIDVAEVQLVADGKVVSKDEHAGWSGLSTQANAYALTVPAGVKTAELRVRLGGAPNDTDSFGTLTVSNGILLPGDPGPVLCGLNCQLPLQAGKVYEFSSVLGTYLEGQLRRAFLRYVERERARSYRQFLHYNCWFDLHINLNEEKILKNVKAFTEEMTVKRGVAMESYVLDDGWDAPREGFWTVDKKKFPSGFDPITAELDRVNSHMGIWISPLAGYAFVGERVGHATKLGLVREGSFLDLSYAPYYEWFRDFCASLVKKNKVNYFKWDKAGDGASPHFMALLSCARELRQVDPNLFFNVTVGTWPSPFWLNVIDSTWRGGEDVNWDWDCKGNDREKWLNYRDGVTYRGVVKTGPLYPLNSIMTHGIVQASLGAAGRASGSGSDLRHEARSYFGSGTALQELYIQPTIMTPAAWDVVAAAAKWARLNSDVLVDTHWVGGDPLKHEIYGWASWTPKKAILTLRNPNDQPQEIKLDAGAVFELPSFAKKDFVMTSPYADQRVQKVEMSAGKPTLITLQPFEVLVLESKPTPLK